VKNLYTVLSIAIPLHHSNLGMSSSSTWLHPRMLSHAQTDSPGPRCSCSGTSCTPGDQAMSRSRSAILISHS
jgi:hypothetical protein